MTPPQGRSSGLAAARQALGRGLREKRGERAQSEIATALGVDQSLYSRWERGEREPSIEQWRALAALHGCALSELVPVNQYPALPHDPEERRAAVENRNTAIRDPRKEAENA